MSAIPMYRAQPWHAVIVKLYNNNYTLDAYSDRLHSQGYEVINTNNYTGALEMAREYHPALIVAQDDPAANIDAIRWLELQHSDHDPVLAMTPLIIVADAARMSVLRTEELPDRVIVLQNRADTLNQLTRTITRVLRVWGLTKI